jgi:hypothetical protein
MRSVVSRRFVVLLSSLSGSLGACNDGSAGDGSAASTSDSDATTAPMGSTGSDDGDDGTEAGADDTSSDDTGDPPGNCERPIAWTPGDTVGVPGGIPEDRAQCATAACQALDSAEPGYRDGTLDALPLIQAAIDSAEPETFVALPAGTWRIDGGVTIGADRDGITLRGAGMDETMIDCRADVCIDVGSSSDYLWSWPTTGNEITGGLTAGSTEIEIADTSAFEVGQIVQVRVANDPQVPVLSVAGFDELRRQMTRVTGKDAASLTVHPPIHADLDHLAARVNVAQQQTDAVGIEDLTIDSSGGATTFGVRLEQTFGCWVKSVKVRHSSNYSVFFTDSLQCEMRTSFLDELDHSGSNGAGLLVNTVSGCLVEDNILIESFPNIEVNHGSSGNVFAYNFINNVDGLIGIDTNHGPHNALNLYEGNVAHNLMSDGYFGGASHDYVFRNWLHGGAGVPGNAPTYCLSLKRFTRDYVLAGNIIGSAGQAQPCVAYGEPNIGNNFSAGEAQPSAGDWWADWTPRTGTTIRGTLTERPDDTHGTIVLDSGTLVVGQSPALNPGGWVTVATVVGDTVTVDSTAFGTTLPPLDTVLAIEPGAGGFQELDLDVEASTQRHGNYYFASGSIPADEALDAPLCDSLYLDGKPAWFGDLPWPPFDADDPTSVDTPIPAQQRFAP